MQQPSAGCIIMNQSVHYCLFQNQLVRYCQLLVKPGGGRPHIVRTTRNSAFPLIMRAYPSAAFASGYFSIIGRTPVIFSNRKVSCESVGIYVAATFIRAGFDIEFENEDDRDTS